MFSIILCMHNKLQENNREVSLSVSGQGTQGCVSQETCGYLEYY